MNRSIDFRDDALRDLDELTRWYRIEAGADIAERFAIAIDLCIEKLSAAPQLGSPVATRSDLLRGLRKRAVKGFPRISMFYLSSGGRVEVVRVLHGAQDWWSRLEIE